MYLSGKPITASPSITHEQKPETVPAGESSDATREPKFRSVFFFGLAPAIDSQSQGSRSWAALLESGRR